MEDAEPCIPDDQAVNALLACCGPVRRVEPLSCVPRSAYAPPARSPRLERLATSLRDPFPHRPLPSEPSGA